MTSNPMEPESEMFPKEKKVHPVSSSLRPGEHGGEHRGGGWGRRPAGRAVLLAPLRGTPVSRQYSLQQELRKVLMWGGCTVDIWVGPQPCLRTP